MVHDRTRPRVTGATVDDVEIPPYRKPSPEELARRGEVIARIRALRAEIGPIDIRADDLLHLAEQEDEG